MLRPSWRAAERGCVLVAPVFESTAVNRRDSTGKMSKPPREEALGMAVCGASHVSGAAWHVRPTRPNCLGRHRSVLTAGSFSVSLFFHATWHLRL
jgi:hypothetical protein